MAHEKSHFCHTLKAE